MDWECQRFNITKKGGYYVLVITFFLFLFLTKRDSYYLMNENLDIFGLRLSEIQYTAIVKHEELMVLFMKDYKPWAR